MVKIEPGTFKMNYRAGWKESNEKPHDVTLTQVYYIGRTEVTQGQWVTIMDKNPSYFRDSREREYLPVENVSWNDAMSFCAKLNEMGLAPKGWKFTLPTEAQWEFAARGGNRSRNYKYSGSNEIDDVAWCSENSGSSKLTDSSPSMIDLFENDCKTHQVRQKKANELGLYDMSGNVLEWCLDDYVTDNTNSPVEFSRRNERDDGSRTVKGGCWTRSFADCAPASRFNVPASQNSLYIGFRLVLVRDSGEQTVKDMLKEDSKNTEQNLNLPGGVPLKMVKVRAGTFEMSAGDGENKPGEVSHQATLTHDFYIGQTEVTQAQWNALMKRNPSEFKGDDLPVENVSWEEAVDFCGKMNELGIAPKGYLFSLPTETQWEYAARGGKDNPRYKYSGSDEVGEVAWYDSNSDGKTHPVAAKTANELGLYDMSGNVQEWCLDQYVEDSSKSYVELPVEDYLLGFKKWKAPQQSIIDLGIKPNKPMTIRGGGWSLAADACRSSFRAGENFLNRGSSIGFRLVLVPASE